MPAATPRPAHGHAPAAPLSYHGAMRLSELLDGLGPRCAHAGPDVEVRGVAIDSRRVRPGDVFFALVGQHTDGRRHVAEALARGACAVAANGPVAAPGAAVVTTAEPRRLLGLVAARLARDPSADLTLVGVTGTNGKTTTTYLLESIWRAAGHRPGVLGTIAYRFGGRAYPAPLTTPEAPVLQELLAAMRAAGTTHVAIEVSSHALALERVAGARFDAAVFTNLTRDHLDFHPTLEDYYAAKARLFLDYLPAGGKPGAVAIVNVDSAAGAQLLATLGTRAVTVGAHPRAAVRPLELVTTLAGTHGVIDLAGRSLQFESRLVGVPHVENVLAAAATAWALGTAPEAIAEGLAAAEPPPGRLERIAGPGFTVVVDYAHSPDALARCLQVLRPLTRRALIAVFGCGGDRDRGKRPLMGAAAGELADVVILTSDNPRTEDPDRIVADIERGVRAAGLSPLAGAGPGVRGYLVEPDRRAAIACAVGLARAGDLVLVAGKGHEDYQIVGTHKRHLDDREEVRRALAALGRKEERPA
jgi:UDP-N-acetylmuramoyl-L-alanyl-D-glutamate--2,6-diaminopimelate ligase